MKVCSRSLSASLALVALSFPAYAQHDQNPPRLDLQCRVTSSSATGVKSDGSRAVAAAVGGIMIVKVDLDSRQFCTSGPNGDCPGIVPIERVDDSFITFVDTRDVTRSLNGRNLATAFFAVNRRSGAAVLEGNFFDNSNRPVGSTRMEMTCTRRSFSGFPSDSL